MFQRGDFIRLFQNFMQVMEAGIDQSSVVTGESASTTSAGSQREHLKEASLVKEASFATRLSTRMKPKQGSNLDDTQTWHGGSRYQAGGPMLRTGSLQQEGGRSKEGTWHGTDRGQRLMSLNRTYRDAELGQLSPRVVVRVIDTQSPLQRWL